MIIQYRHKLLILRYTSDRVIAVIHCWFFLFVAFAQNFSLHWLLHLLYNNSFSLSVSCVVGHQRLSATGSILFASFCPCFCLMNDLKWLTISFYELFVCETQGARGIGHGVPRYGVRVRCAFFLFFPFFLSVFLFLCSFLFCSLLAVLLPFLSMGYAPKVYLITCLYFYHCASALFSQAWFSAVGYLLMMRRYMCPA